ncbi:MAG TPA: VTT domain-containing protein, partial [Candidatus Paceibacterota bacterium]|nr:VTT domain-containing protein [Candidatus Paceibacterota bacterium]
VGWTIGASVAFSIARRYGLPLVIRLVGERRAVDFRDRVPRTNLFASVILLRMLVPVDLLSYALGLFTDMSWRSYVVATALGVAPFGFYFAYAGTLPLWYQFLAVAIALVFATVIALRYFRRAK